MVGVCECKPEFERQDDGICAPVDLKSLPDIISEKILDLANKSVPVTKKHLSVIAESKQVSSTFLLQLVWFYKETDYIG